MSTRQSMRIKRVRFLTIIVMVSASCLLASSSPATVILNPDANKSSVRSDVHDGNGSIPQHEIYPASMPWGGLTSIDNGLEFSTTTYDFTQNSFKMNFEHIGNSTTVSWPSNKAKRQFARSWGGVYFSVDVETPYTLTGGYNSVGPRRTYMLVQLRDTSGGYHFENTQDSRTSTSNTFVIGQQNGDTYNTLTGNQTGTLYPGRVYSLFYEFRFENYGPAPDWIGVGTANGSLNLYTPEPATLTLLALGGLAMMRRRRKQPCSR